MTTPPRRDRYHGAILGLAAGDALGTTLEFKAPNSFTPITDMVGGGPFGLQPGQWTDDTSMALCLAESLIVAQGFDPADQMQRYIKWWRTGYFSSTDRCFDIGNTVRAALQHYETTGEPFSGSTDPYTAGNGALMRLAPVPLAYAADPELAIQRAADSARTTHGATEALDANRYYAALILGALNNESKTALLASHYTPVPDLWQRAPLAPKIAAIADGSFKHRNPPDIQGAGYVVPALEAALWAFHHSDDFATGALLAANLGRDADTTAAIYGQLAGAYYGVEGIPAHWRSKLTHLDTLSRLADQLLELATQSPR